MSQQFDIAVNINSEILAADWGHDCIYVFTLDGNYINKVTLHKGTSILQLATCCITTDSSGFILIADTTNNCVLIFDRIGNCICHLESYVEFRSPQGIAMAPKDDEIYVSDTGNGRVQVFSFQREQLYT